MAKELKSFKDVEDEIRRMREDFIKTLERKRINNIALGVASVKGTVTTAFKPPDAELLNSLIQQFNKLLNNIHGQ